eukprot:scaffold8097_cov59-Phaeocystis_antarctica.AAC.2
MASKFGDPAGRSSLEDMIRPLKLLLQVEGVVCEEARKLASGRYAAELPATFAHINQQSHFSGTPRSQGSTEKSRLISILECVPACREQH